MTNPLNDVPQVVRQFALGVQVCIPKHWNDHQVLEFASGEYPCGTTNGWHIRKEGDPLLDGASERMQCTEVANHVHIMLDA